MLRILVIFLLTISNAWPGEQEKLTSTQEVSCEGIKEDNLKVNSLIEGVQNILERPSSEAQLKYQVAVRATRYSVRQFDCPNHTECPGQVKCYLTRDQVIHVKRTSGRFLKLLGPFRCLSKGKLITIKSNDHYIFNNRLFIQFL
jgi:hypothetical protein